MHPDLIAAERMAGIIFMGQPNADFQKKNGDAALTVDLAMDAQPQLVTLSNAGIPAMFTTYIDPNIIDILVAPMKATEIVGRETKKGDWLMETAMFPIVEATGETSAYGDYSENGQASANVNYENRQSFTYQTFTLWGEREMERAGLGRIDWSNQLNKSSVQVLNKFQNKSYFFGVAGLLNYGLLNDPSLPAVITPGIKAKGGTQWVLANGQINATDLEVIADVQALFATIQENTFGLIEITSNMTLAMSPVSEVAMTITNQFNNPVADLLKKIFPNLKIKVAPEYATSTGNLVQLIVDEVEGQRTAETAFTEKLRAHPIVVGSSNFKQKKSQGTWGTIIYRPIFIQGMLGV